MNNKPITARVKSGMFKTKEPLLNVGPAGVDGNNTTRTMPSPSKMKGYKMKSSPFKQQSQGQKNVKEAIKDQITDQGISLGTIKTTNTPGTGGTEGTPDVITEPTETFTGEKATGEKAKEWAKQNEYCKGKPKGTPGCSGFHKYEGGAVEKGTEGTPGTDDKEVKEETAIIEKVARTGQTQQAYESRNNIRRGIQANRKVKKGDIKNARSKAKGGGYYKNDGTFVKASDNKGVGETRKAARVANRAQKKEDKEDLKGVESGKDKRVLRKQMKEARQDTKKKAIQKAKDKVRGFKDEKSDAKARQNKRNQDIAKSEARNAQIQSTQGKSGFSTGNKDLVQDDVTRKQGEETPERQRDLGTPVEMNKPGFFKKKSPMKMNYFKK